MDERMCATKVARFMKHYVSNKHHNYIGIEHFLHP